MALVAYVIQSSVSPESRPQGAHGIGWDRIAARVDALDRDLWQRATALATAAGIGVMRNVWHNAMLAHESGRPWHDVDYSLLRAAIRVEARRDTVWALRSRLWRSYERQHYPDRFADEPRCAYRPLDPMRL